VLALVAGCGGGDEAEITKAELPRIVIQPDDLPRVWILFDEGRQALADAPAGLRSDPRRFDRVEGWKARYRRAGSVDARGPLVIESRADLFESGDGAEQDFGLLEGELEATLTDAARRVAAPELGDEAVAATLLQGTVRFYSVAWRQDNVVAAILVNGFARALTFEQVIELARRQERRIAQAGEN
jgi:hypothetical protein